MGVSAAGALATGYSESEAIKGYGAYKAGLASTNAAMAGLAGKETIEQGDIAAGNKDLETRARVGSELASQGASGVSVGSGTSALVRSGTDLVGQIDAATIRNNAQRKAFGYQVQATQDTAEAQFDKMSAASQSMQTFLSGGLQAISDPLNIYSNSLRWSRYFDKGGNGRVPPDGYIGGSSSGGFVDTGDIG